MKCPHCQSDVIKVQTPNDYSAEDPVLAVCEDTQYWDFVSMFQCTKDKEHVFYLNDGGNNDPSGLPIIEQNFEE